MKKRRKDNGKTILAATEKKYNLSTVVNHVSRKYKKEKGKHRRMKANNAESGLLKTRKREWEKKRRVVEDKMKKTILQKYMKINI